MYQNKIVRCDIYYFKKILLFYFDFLRVNKLKNQHLKFNHISGVLLQALTY